MLFMVDISAYAPNCQFMSTAELIHVHDTADLGNAIRRWRQAKALRQSDLGQCLGVHRVTIAKLERGEPVSSVTAIKALSMLGAMAVIVATDNQSDSAREASSDPL